MEEIIKFLKDEGCEFVVGWKERERVKTISEAIKKLRNTHDEKKIEIVKRLSRYYFIFRNIEHLLIQPDILLEEDKYGLLYNFSYLAGFIDVAKISITGVIKALGK